MVKLPPLAPRTPEQRVEARLERVVRAASRGGGVLLRSELAAQNEVLARDNEVLRAQLAQSEEKRQACEAQLDELRAKLAESERKLERALKESVAGPKPAPPEPELLVDGEPLEFALGDRADGAPELRFRG
eukprot:COSAG04_NODE_11981_length_677_cov_1.128028_1_plen_130_part_10